MQFSTPKHFDIRKAMQAPVSIAAHGAEPITADAQQVGELNE